MLAGRDDLVGLPRSLEYLSKCEIMILRILTALISLVVVYLVYNFLSSVFWELFIGVFLMLAFFEWGGLCGIKRRYYLVVSFVIWAVFVGYGIDFPGWIFGLNFGFWLFVAPIIIWNRFSFKSALMVRRIVAAVLGWVLIFPVWGVLRSDDIGEVVLILMLVWCADSGAYVIGKFFGRRRLSPMISPNKSWEGVAGAFVCVNVYVLILIYFDLLPYSVNPLIVILFGWLLLALSVEGDLFESLMKRNSGVKDSGGVLPGHGGVLDRIDSWLSTVGAIGLLICE